MSSRRNAETASESTAVKVSSYSEDTAAAQTVKVYWSGDAAKLPIEHQKRIHSERLCREAIALGIVRETLGWNPRSLTIV